MNGEAAALLMRSPDQYTTRVKDYVKRYAREEDADNAGKGKKEGPGAGASMIGDDDVDEEEEEEDEDEDEEDEDEEMSDPGEDPEEPVGELEM